MLEPSVPYDWTADDLGRSLDKKSNAAVIMRSNQLRLAKDPAVSPGPGQYNPKLEWERPNDPSSESNYYFRTAATERRQQPGVPNTAQLGEVPGPGHYAVVSPSRFDDGNPSSNFVGVQRARKPRKEPPTAIIDSNWRMATDAKTWAGATPPAYASTARFDQPFSRDFANRSPSIGRAMIRELMQRSVRREEQRRRSGSSRRSPIGQGRSTQRSLSMSL
jgi:hypothetical protein